MSDGPLFDFVPPKTDRHGVTYERAWDFDRLNGQAARVFHAMKDGEPRTLREIADITGDPEASISARLREFNMPEMSAAGLSMKKRRRGDERRGLYEYWLVFNA